MKEVIATILVVITFGILLLTAIKAYIKVNIGKEKKENIEVNNYILGSVVYSSITTILSIICVLKFL